MGPVNVAGLASLAMVSGGELAVRHPGGVRDAVTAVRILGPVSCTIRPLVLRVRVPRDRPEWLAAVAAHVQTVTRPTTSPAGHWSGPRRRRRNSRPELLDTKVTPSA